MPRHAGPAPPAALRGDARRRWQQVAPSLAARGPLDVATLTTYCQIWARWRAAEQHLAKNGNVVKTRRGTTAPSPFVAISGQARTQLHQLEKALRIHAPDMEPPHEREENAGGLLTRRELAPRIGVHMQTITKWEREGLPIASAGGRGRASLYREADVRTWMKTRETVTRTDGLATFTATRTRKEHWQALLAEQQHRQRSGELLPRDEVERMWAAEVAAVRAVILSSYLTGVERVHHAAVTEGPIGVERTLRELAHRILNQLASQDRPVAPQDPSADDLDLTAAGGESGQAALAVHA